MFPIEKLKKLPEKTRLRKIVLILKAMEIELYSGNPLDNTYLDNLMEILPDNIISRSKYPVPGETLIRKINNIRHLIRKYLNMEPAEWDIVDFKSGNLNGKKRIRLPIRVYLEDIRSPYNVGAIFRTAEAFGAEKIYLSPGTPLPTHQRATKTARGAEKIVPWKTGFLPDILKKDYPVFALELGGIPVEDFNFPERGIVLIGSEELGLSPEALSIAESRYGRVSIPMGGAKKSLNVSVAFGILMFYWFSRNLRR